MNYILENYFGFGDNIYHIPFVHHLSTKGEVNIFTPFPELFQFKNVFCFKPATNLKLQLENMQRSGLYSSGKTPSGTRIRFNYAEGFRKKQTIMQSFESVVPLEGSFFFKFTPKPSAEANAIVERARQSGKKLCVVRLPSVRKEWPDPERNGKMDYFQTCINRMKDRYYFVSVGDIGNNENYDGPEPLGIDEKRDRHFVNHLKIWDVIALINQSDMVLSIQCNILPICQILRKKGFFIYGGYAPHWVLNDSRFYQVGYAEPDPFCFCISRGHACNKEISEEKLLSRLEETIKQ